MSDQNLLNENTTVILQDQLYRRQGRHIIIAQIESLVPLLGVLEPNIWGGGSSEYTWGRIQQFFIRHPFARKNQLPMHYYTEYLFDDYVTYVGCPLSNTSWFLQQAVAAKVLPIQYLDAVLIVLQENFGIETIERRLWRMLSHSTLTPLMRMLEVPRERVLFFEKIADRTALRSPEWPFRFREPTYLDPIQLDLFLKDYEKR